MAGCLHLFRASCQTELEKACHSAIVDAETRDPMEISNNLVVLVLSNPPANFGNCFINYL
jgi:hypothetical protein